MTKSGSRARRGKQDRAEGRGLKAERTGGAVAHDLKVVGPASSFSRGWILAATGVLVALTIIAFSPVLRAQFTNWDDDVNVTRNPHLYPASIENLAWLWTNAYRHLYVPMVYSVYAVELAIAGAMPLLFHATNLALHCASVVLVFIMLLKLSGPAKGEKSRSAIIAAILGAAVFAIHPVQVEPVAWVTGLKDVLSGFFSLAAVSCYLNSRTDDKRRASFYASHALFLFALLSKPAAVTLPLIMMAIDVFVLGERASASMRRLAAFWIIAIGAAAAAAGSQPIKTTFTQIVPAWYRPFVAADSLWFYAGKLLWPLNLAPVYGRYPTQVFHRIGGVAGLPCVLVAAGLLWKFGGRWRAPAAIVIAGVLPVLGLTPFLFQTFSTTADRYLYVSMFGIALAVNWGVQSIWVSAAPTAQRVVIGAISVVLIALAALTFAQARIWHDSLSLWSTSMHVHDQNAEVRNNYGNALIEQKRFKDALPQFQAAVALDPNFADAHNNLGNVLVDLGDIPAGINHFERSIALRPESANPFNNLGSAYFAQGKFAQAADAFRRAAELDTRLVEAQANLALAYERLGKTDDAIAAGKRAESLSPHNPQIHATLARLLRQAGRTTEAAVHERMAAATSGK